MTIRGVIRSAWFPVMWSIFFGLIFMTDFGIWSWVSFFLSLVFLLDARARLKTYFYMCRNPPKAARIPALIMILRGSFCSRQVAIALFPFDAPKIYEILGYKWYHIVPDGFFKGRILLSKRFWKSVFTTTKGTKNPYEKDNTSTCCHRTD